MMGLHLRAPNQFEAGFAAIRKELDVPPQFSAAVLEEASKAEPTRSNRIDARHIPLIAIDPPGATDLDQAFAAEKMQSSSGYRIFYAIADVAAFVSPGGLIDVEARKRGVTLYSPDMRTPLHPPAISEDKASLLPNGDRIGLLWTIEIDGEGEPTNARLERAEVEVTEAISYAKAQRRIDSGDQALVLLKEIGLLRQQQETKRGGVSLNLPSQELVESESSYRLSFDESLPVENWNAQISLLTGIVAAERMAETGVGLLRTLPPVEDQDLNQLRNTGKALGLNWAESESYANFVGSVNPNDTKSNAFLLQAARTLRGAGYLGFINPLEPSPEIQHSAIASIYAHVTAPLRRLIDRFGNEILLASYHAQQTPNWALEAVEELPSLMGKARQKESQLERAMINFAETMVLENHVGSTFDGFVVDLDSDGERATIQMKDPAIVAKIDGQGRTLAEEVKLKLESTNSAARTVTFTVLE